MEKIAIINLNSDSIKMQFVNVNKNKSFAPYRKMSMPINLTKDFYSDNFIKPAIGFITSENSNITSTFWFVYLLVE